LPAATVQRLIGAVEERLKRADAVVIEDYGKGVITRQFLEAVIPLARRHRKIITVDPKQEHFDLYQRVTALTPNRMEAGEAMGRDLETDGDVERAGEEILRRLECEAVLITLGEDGMWLFEQGGRRQRIPTVAQEVFDVAGAGDTVIATFTLALASGASMEQAARIANHAAGIVVGKLGVAVATPEELRTRLRRRR
jgi:rfaE bifunctional protein kinase chain/domain